MIGAIVSLDRHNSVFVSDSVLFRILIVSVVDLSPGRFIRNGGVKASFKIADLAGKQAVAGAQLLCELTAFADAVPILRKLKGKGFGGTIFLGLVRAAGGALQPHALVFKFLGQA